MKSKRLFRLQVGVIIALVLYIVLAVYMFFAIPAGQPKWSSIGLANSEIQSADLQRLRTDLHSAVSSLATFRHDKNELLLVSFAATISTICFLGWSLFIIGRVKREDSIHDAF